MRAIRVNDYGGPELVLRMEEAPTPQPQAGQVLVKLFAAGVNPADWKYRSGMMKNFMPLRFPWTPGLEGAGRVEALRRGPGCRWARRSSGRSRESYAEYAVAVPGDLQAMPAKLNFDQAATLSVGALTAWGALIETAQVKAGQRVLVHGAAGGVGAYVVQLARWKGAHVLRHGFRRQSRLRARAGRRRRAGLPQPAFRRCVLHDLDIVDRHGGGRSSRAIDQSAAVRRDLCDGSGTARPGDRPGGGGAGDEWGAGAGETLGQISQLVASGQLTAGGGTGVSAGRSAPGPGTQPDRSWAGAHRAAHRGLKLAGVRAMRHVSCPLGGARRAASPLPDNFLTITPGIIGFSTGTAAGISVTRLLQPVGAMGQPPAQLAQRAAHQQAGGENTDLQTGFAIGRGGGQPHRFARGYFGQIAPHADDGIQR